MNLNKALALAALSAPALAGGPAAERRVTRVRFVMGTACEIDARGEAAAAAVEDAFAELERWDRILSLYKEDSEASALNRSAGRAPFRASPEFFAAAAEALRLARLTGGAFDPTVAPALRQGPAGLPLVGWSKVRLDPAARTIELPARGMGLDFGGIGKGWALDRAAERLRARGIRDALLNFGGQLLAIGRTEVELPGLGSLELRDASLSVSGDSERPGHIVSPFDGRPVRRPGSAAALLASAAEADAWSTALYVLGAAPKAFPGRSFFVHPPAARKGDRS